LIAILTILFTLKLSRNIQYQDIDYVGINACDFVASVTES